MSTSKHIDKICIAAIALMLVLTILFVSGEKLGIEVISDEEGTGYFSQNDILSDWDTSEATFITLSDDDTVVSGNGAYVNNSDIHIACAGRYVVSGSLSNGRIVIDADGDDKVWLMLSGADLTCEDSAAILVEQADKVFLSLADGTENTISSGDAYSETAQKSGIDGVIYSRDDLTINGSGTLSVSGEYAHGIVCNDSLKITAGSITVSAPQDAIHANDCVCIKEATLDLNAGDDGITVSNDEQSDYMYIESGDIRISGCYEGLEATTVTVAGGNIDITPTDDGINAEKLIEISGGSVRIVNENGRDADGLDSNKDIVISGGKLFISVSQSGGCCAIDYGSENQGECRIDGGTVIACGSNTMLEAISASSKQAFTMKSVSGEANTALTLVSSDGTQLISETIPVAFSSVTLSTPEMKNSDVCTLTVGNTTQEISVDSSTESIGGSGFGGGMGNGWNGFERGGMGDGGGMAGGNDMPGQAGADGTVPEMPSGNIQPGGDNASPPQIPDEFQNTPDGGNMPGWQSGSPPEMPEGENRGGIQRPDSNNAAIPDGSMTVPPSDMPEQRENAQGDPNGNMAPSFSGDQDQDVSKNTERYDENMSFDARDAQAPDELSGVSDKAQWRLIGLSGVVLAVGLLIVLKKKY